MKYTVPIRWVCAGDYVVEAESPQEAFNIADGTLTPYDVERIYKLPEDVIVYDRTIHADDDCPHITDENGNSFDWDIVTGIIEVEDEDDEDEEEW